MGTFARALALWVCMGLALTLAALGITLLPARSATAPPSAFSAQRAMADVRLLGARPHPIGSVRNIRVRAELIERMADLGLSPEAQDAVGLDQAEFQTGAVSAGTVRNVIGVLPGRDRKAPALLLMAHYDSVPNSPGAADDIAGVSTLLEIARLLAATGPHHRDVIFLCTEGEEAGLLGADAFFRGDPLRPHVGLVINLEARGDAGRTAMFQTGPQNGALIALYAKTAQRPFANSLTGFIYKLLPNDTDFTYAVRQGVAGLNFAFLGDQLAYHTPLATPDHLSIRSVQNMGDQVTPVVLALADAQALPPQAPDRAYFDILSRAVVSYPPAFGWAVVAAAVILIALAFVGAVPRGEGGWTDRAVGALWGAGAAMAAVLAAALTEHLASRLLNSAGYVAGYHLYRTFTLDAVGAALLALGAVLAVYASAARARGGGLLAALALLAGGVCCVHGLDALGLGLAVAVAVLMIWIRRRRVALWDSWFGTLILLCVFAILVQGAAPLASPLLVWPLFAGALGAAIWAWLRRVAPLSAVLYPATLAVVIGAILASVAIAIFTAIGPVSPEVLAVFVLLYLAGLAPFVEGVSRAGRPGLIAAVVLAAGGCSLLKVGASVATPARPELTQAFYLADGADGPQVRVDPFAALDPWSTQTLKADGGQIHRGVVPPFVQTPVWLAAARRRSLTPPKMHLEQHGSNLILQALATGGGRVLYLYLRSPQPMRIEAVNDAVVGVAIKPQTWGVVDYSAPPPKGVKLQLSATPHAQIDAVVIEQRDGWPADAQPPPRPPQLMAWRNSDTTLVMARASLAGRPPAAPKSAPVHAKGDPGASRRTGSDKVARPAPNA